MKTSIVSLTIATLVCSGTARALDFVTTNLDPAASPQFGYPGIVGTRFGVEANDIPAGAQVKVTHLGFYAGVPGRFTGAGVVDVEHNVTLDGPQNYNNRSGDFSSFPVASVMVPVDNPVDSNGWSWVELPSPVILQGGQYYVIAVDNVTNSLDPYFDPTAGPGGSAVIVTPESIFRNGAGNDTYMQGRYGLAAGQEAFAASGYLGASFQYTLDTAPVLTTELPAVTVAAEGGNANFSVTLNPAGYPAVDYLWEHDPLPIDNVWVTVGTDPAYSITSVTAAAAGNYRVTVSNTAGSAQSTGSLEVDSDADSDGLANAVETNTGIYVSPTDTGTNPNDDDSDNDGLKDGPEVLTHNTNPNIADTDGDGLLDGDEVNTHSTNPIVADTDGDGLLDGAEVNTHSTNPLLVDTDADGVRDGYEVTNGSSPTNPESPGGPNPTAIAVRFDNQYGEVTGYGLSPIMYAGAPAVRQKNWNSTNPDAFPAVGTEGNIVSPSSGVLVNNAGNPTTMTMSYSAVGAWADNNEDDTTYGRLFGPFIYNDSANPDVNISLGSIPYAAYDVYVYIGSSENGLTGTVTSGATTYSYTSASGATTAGGLSTYVETTSATGFPQANYCVFRNVTGSTFAFTASHVSGNAGVFGFQVVESTATTAYQTWAAANALDPNTDGAPGFDKENDGASNLLEYAFFTNPNSGTSIPVFPPATGGGNLSLTYNRAKAATDITYNAQWSENLTDWFQTGLTDVVTGNETADTVERVVTVIQDGAPKKFLRIHVSIPTP
jgi:hypothetical protein